MLFFIFQPVVSSSGDLVSFTALSLLINHSAVRNLNLSLSPKPKIIQCQWYKTFEKQIRVFCVEVSCVWWNVFCRAFPSEVSWLKVWVLDEASLSKEKPIRMHTGKRHLNDVISTLIPQQETKPHGTKSKVTKLSKLQYQWVKCLSLMEKKTAKVTVKTFLKKTCFTLLFLKYCIILRYLHLTFLWQQ